MHNSDYPSDEQLNVAATEVEMTPITIVPEPLPPCHVMLDLETWGTGNDAVVVSIGACKFDKNDILDAFHVGVDPKSCMELGLKVDAGTILWWMAPEQREALDLWLQLERVDLASALVGFDMWCKHQPSTMTIWGNGSTFDNVILRSAFAAAGLEYPVRFWADQCYRTKKNESPTVPMVREGTHHKALDDAISQAKHLQAIWRSEDPQRYIDRLEKDQGIFTFYADNHRAKGTPEADEKAKVNEDHALDIRRLLDGGPNDASLPVDA
jgi:hypothetical protein